MWINRQKQTVATWELQRGDSNCPLCDRALVPRRGQYVRWHWAHKARTSRHSGCPWEESPWHLEWKLAFLDVAGWEIERIWEAGGNRFVLDACRLDRGLVIEFVHSMRPHYLAKHAALRESGLDVRWVLDGSEWTSARMKPTLSGEGMRRFMKARAFDVFQDISCLVHFDGDMWRHWKKNIWYPADGPTAVEFLDRLEYRRFRTVLSERGY